MLYNRAQLVSYLNLKVISGGRSTTAQNVRDFENTMITSVVNWADDTDTDGTLAANSDLKIATQKATKTYIDNLIANITLQDVLSVGNTTGGNNIVMSGSDKITDSASASSFLDLNSQRLYFTDGVNDFGVYSDLSSGVIELKAQDMSTPFVIQSYVQTLVNGVNIGSYSQPTGNETKIMFTTTTSEISSTYATYSGLRYNADYSANYTIRSLVDKGYVTGGFVPYTGATTRLEMGTNDILFDSGYGIDTQTTGGTDTLNIGATNAEVINYGNANTIHNFLGTAIYELQVNSYVTDKLITLNYGGSLASGIGVGFEIEENSVITGYLKTNASRNAYSFKTPAINFYSDFSLASLTANRTHTLPDQDGTFTVLGNTTTGSGSIVLGTQPTFTQWITVPRIYGGTGVNDGIDFYSTSGNGTGGSVAHRFLGGNNGATTILTMLNDGTIRIPNNRTIQGTDSIGTDRNLIVWSSGDNISIIGRPGTTDINLNPTSAGIGLYVKSGGDGGIGVASPVARWHIIKTSEQLRVGYDTSNYLSTTISSAGDTTMNLVGTGSKLLNITANTSIGLRITNNSLITAYLGSDGSGAYFGSLTAHDVYLYRGNTLRLTITSSSFLFADSYHLQFNTTNGSKIGTSASQKIGKWGVTPIVQPSGWGTPTGSVTRTTFDTTTVTLSELAERVAGLITDLKATGEIGA